MSYVNSSRKNEACGCMQIFYGFKSECAVKYIFVISLMNEFCPNHGQLPFLLNIFV